MIKQLYQYRFEIFFITQIMELFGALIVPARIHDPFADQFFFFANIMAGILLISHKRRLTIFFVALIISDTLANSLQWIQLGADDNILTITRLSVYFLFYGVVNFEIMRQIWKLEVVDNSAIFGLLDGFIALGFVGFLLCFSIELTDPGSFNGLSYTAGEKASLGQELIYFSYITLTSIGYGDITPKTLLAKQASLLIGISGQFYLVIVTAIIVGKYIQQSEKEKAKG